MTAEDEARARQIVDGWYWQPAEGHIYRFAHALHGKVIYKDLAPAEADMVELVTQYLSSRTNVQQLVINNKLHTFTEGWDTKDCWFQTTPGNKFEGSDAEKVRLYWALVKPGSAAATGDGPYTIENGCQYAVTHKFYWDVQALPTLPASSSGVQYTMQGVTRDKETGYFSCVVECRTRVQQDVPEFVSSVTAFEEERIEQHLGVKQSDLAGAGKQASVSSGTIVRREVTKNPDCTSDVRNVTTTEQSVSGAVETVTEGLRGSRVVTENRSRPGKAPTTNLSPGDSVRNEKTPGNRWNQTISRLVRRAASILMRKTCQQTIFAHTHTTTENVATEPGFEHSVAAGGGKIVEKSAVKTEEGWDVTEQVTEEKNVQRSVVEVQKTIRGVRTTVTDRGQSSPVGESGLADGESRSSRKTDGGRYDNVKSTIKPSANAPISDESAEDIFEKVNSETKVASARSAEGSSAGGGVIVRIENRKTEEGWDVTKRRTEEKPVAQAVVTVRESARVITTERLDRNQPEAATPSGPRQSVRVEKTPGGLHNNTVTTTVPKTGIVRSESSGATSVSVSTVVYTRPAGAPGAARSIHIGGPNAVVERSCRLADDGVSEEYVETQRQYRPDVKSKTIPGVHHDTVVESGINAVNVTPGNAGRNQAIDFSMSPNEHGSFSYTKVQRTFKPQTAHARSATPIETVDQTTTINAEGDNPGLGGRYCFATSSPNEHGSFTNTVRKVNPQAKTYTKVWISEEYSGTHTHNGERIHYFRRYRCTLTVFRNQQTPPAVPSNASVSVSISINQYGLLDGAYQARFYEGMVSKNY